MHLLEQASQSIKMKKVEGNKRPLEEKDSLEDPGNNNGLTAHEPAVAIPESPVAVVEVSVSMTERDQYAPESKRRKHNAITISQKQGVLQLIDEGKTYEEISRIYGIAPSTITGIKENRQQIIDLSLNVAPLSNQHMKLLKPRLSRNALILDQRLCEWIVSAQQRNYSVSGPKIVEKAKLVASKLNIEFKGSNGWLESFKKRHNISFRDFRRTSAPSSSILTTGDENEGEEVEGDDNLKEWERKILFAEVDPNTFNEGGSLLEGVNGAYSSDMDSESEVGDGNGKAIKKLVAEVADDAAKKGLLASSSKDISSKPRSYAQLRSLVPPPNGGEALQNAVQGLIGFTNYCDQYSDIAKLIGVSEPVKQLLRGIIYETSKLPSKK